MTTSTPALISDRRLTFLSIVLLIGTMTTILDTTIVNIALDQLHVVFGASIAETQWVATGYLLALASVIPLTGWAAQRFGGRRVWMFAVALFLVGSVLCGLAWSLPSLITFRVLQGLGGGMVLPLTMTLLTQAAGPARLGRAMASIGLPAQLAPILGPVIGGAIIDSWSWHWLFFVNVPLCIAALVLAPFALPAEGGDRSRRFDVRGFLMLTPALVSLVLSVHEVGATGGFGDIRVLAPLVLGIALLVGFIAYALRMRDAALVDVHAFGRRSFGLSAVITFLGGFSMYASMLVLPLFYQEVRGHTAFETGLLLIPQGLGTILYLLVQGRFARIDTRFIVGGGVVLTMLGTIPFLFADASGSAVLLLVGQFVRGIGMGASSIPLMTLALGGLERAEVPRASAAFSIVQRVGAPFGTAVVAVILQGYVGGANGTADLAGAFNSTFWWVLAFSVVPLVLAFLLPKPKAAMTVPAAETSVAAPPAAPAAASVIAVEDAAPTTAQSDGDITAASTPPR